MSKNSLKLRYVKGTCELEKGVVSFIGSMNSVSNRQAWYYTIYAIKDKFPEIDYWIDPIMKECRGLTSSEYHIRREVAGKFNCRFEPFPNGEIRPKRKLSAASKRNYEIQRANADLNLEVNWEDDEIDDGVPCGPSKYICADGMRSSWVSISLELIEKDIRVLSKDNDGTERLREKIEEIESILNVEYNFKDEYMLRMTTACESLKKTCDDIVKEFGINDVEKGMCYISIVMMCNDFIDKVKFKKYK